MSHMVIALDVESAVKMIARVRVPTRVEPRVKHEEFAFG